MLLYVHIILCGQTDDNASDGGHESDAVNMQKGFRFLHVQFDNFFLKDDIGHNVRFGSQSEFVRVHVVQTIIRVVAERLHAGTDEIATFLFLEFVLQFHQRQRFSFAVHKFSTRKFWLGNHVWGH